MYVSFRSALMNFCRLTELTTKLPLYFLAAILLPAVVAANMHHGSDDPPSVKDLLAKAVDDIEASSGSDRHLLASIMDLQLRLGETQDAKRTFQRFMQSPAGPHYFSLRDLGHMVIARREPEDFQSILDFFNQHRVVSPLSENQASELEEMKINMIARAAKQQKLDIAFRVLDQMAVRPEAITSENEKVLQGHDTITAAKYFIYALLEQNKTEELHRLIKRFPNSLARARVVRIYYESCNSELYTEKEIDKLMVGADPVGESMWVRAKLKPALKREDAAKAFEVVERLRQLNAVPYEYLVGDVVQLLRKKGEAKKAEMLLQTSTENAIDQSPIPGNSSYTLRQLAEQHVKSGNIDKVISLCGSWSRHNIRATQPLATSYQQPLCKLARSFAKKGDLDKALEIAAEIEDDYWRIDTLYEISNELRKTSPLQRETLLERAWQETSTIEPAKDRSWLRRKILSVTIDKAAHPEITFEQAQKRISQLEVIRDQAIILSGQFQYHLDKLTDDQIRQTIETIAGGDTTYLEYVVDLLVNAKKTDFAAMAALRIDFDPRYDSPLQKTFGLILDTWPLDRQLEFLSQVNSEVRAPLLKRILKQDDPKDEARVLEACFQQLRSGYFDQALFEAILVKALNNRDIALLKKTSETAFKEYYQEESARQEVEERWTELLKTEPVWAEKAEATLSQPWIQQACILARFKIKLAANDHGATVRRIDTLPVSNFRGRLRFLLASHLFARVAEPSNASSK